MTLSSDSQICGYPFQMEKTVKVRIDDIEEYFVQETDVFSYLRQMEDEVSLYQKLGIWKLINSGDKRWGKNGFEHMGIERDNWERDRQYQGLSMMLRRARNYARFALMHQDTKAYDGMSYNDWMPIQCKEDLLKSPLVNQIKQGDVNMNYKEHSDEFGIFSSNPVTGLVYVMGFLADVKDMYQANSQNREIIPHLEDAREMISTITQRLAEEKGYKIEDNLIKVNGR